MKRIIIIISILLIASFLAADPMLSFKLPDMNNKDVSLSDVLGKGPVIIDFWASWCNPCKTSMPYLNDLAIKYDSLTVVMISVDAAKDITKAKNFIKSKDFKFTALFDSDKSISKKMNVSSVPHTFILDKNGEIIYSHVGFEPGTELKYEYYIRQQLNLPTEAE